MSTEATQTCKTPTRTCVACGKGGAKRDLVRFARSKEGVVCCDATGRAQGRGAYVCADLACFSLAEKKKRLERALKHTLSTEDYRHLEETFRVICKKQQQVT